MDTTLSKTPSVHCPRADAQGPCVNPSPAGPTNSARPSFYRALRRFVSRAASVRVVAAGLFASAAMLAAPADDVASAAEPKRFEAPAPAKMGIYLGDYAFTARDGKQFTIKEYSAGKPLVLSLIYTGCETTCSTVSSSLARAFKRSGSGLGGDFKALTVGFDTDADSPAKMQEFGKNFSAGLKSDAWAFASADRTTIEKLSKELGFYYKRSGEEFEHFNMVSVIDGEGKLRRQVYGAEFDADELVNAATGMLRLVGSNQPPPGEGLFGKLLALCYTYDEATGTYKIDFSFFVGLGIFVLVQCLFVALAFYFVKGSRRFRAAKEALDR